MRLLRTLVLILFCIGCGAAMAGHIFIAWGTWIGMGLVVRRIGRRREYWRNRRRLRDAYMRAYLKNTRYRW